MFCNAYSKQEIAMKNLMKNHPEWEDACDTVLSLLSGGFALPTVGFVWVRELAGRKKGKRN